ncbi:glycosyltransferase family protein [Cetobacterium sp. SF1]|uniref:glycosyltransferase family protein n=1 Tax=Cetobacterium sp. SF1 TaxID=3417654 RepID=UPI003CEEB10C
MKKVLIISNNCFSNSGSNGRTLENLFYDWDKEKIAQFYINSEIPNSEVCNNYYQITDKDVLKKIFSKKLGRVLTNENLKEKLITKKKQNKKSALKMLIRNFLWNVKKVEKNSLNDWLEKFNPEIIFLMAGDSPFIYNIARKIAQQKKIPLIIYNTEDYIFKKNDYFIKKNKLFYFIFKKILKNSFEKTIKYSNCSIYLNEKLQKTYHTYYNHKSYVVMNSGRNIKNYSTKVNKKLRISYFGNLGLGRIESLIQVGEIVKEIDKNLEITIYGKITEEQKEILLNNDNVLTYKGEISYAEVIKNMAETDILLHIENFSDYYREELKHAFSTKIPDCLYSHRCFLLYAPREIAVTEYLLNNKAAWVADDKNKLREILQKIIKNKDMRKKYVEAGLSLAIKNHNLQNNLKKVMSLIENEGKY